MPFGARFINDEGFWPITICSVHACGDAVIVPGVGCGIANDKPLNRSTSARLMRLREDKAMDGASTHYGSYGSAFSEPRARVQS